ncbi:hypothetical protein [Streptomyces sp. NPDC058773]|uniref:hypothetical protein n=1 Tax=Streptomyces sp. NPDC058773 TaxID=3346632 RepID=UPI00368F14EE
MARERQAAADGMAEAEVACGELAEVLARSGIVLPSLSVDPVTYGYEQSRVLVELGRCNVATTRKLIDVLKRAGR